MLLRTPPCADQATGNAQMAADRAGEALLDVGQPEIIEPVVGADGDRMRASVVGAIDQHAALAHLAEGAGGRNTTYDNAIDIEQSARNVVSRPFAE